MFKRKWPWVVAVLLVAGVAFVGWWFWDALHVPTEPEQLILYSIDGRDHPHYQMPKTEEQFHRIPILGKIEITEPRQKREIMTALRKGIIQFSPGSEAKCFWPRHGMRTIESGKVTDYVICFECSQLHVHQGESRKWLGTSPRPQPVLDDILTTAGVPLAPKSH